MNIKRFYAATAREALAKARMTFGDGTRGSGGDSRRVAELVSGSRG